MAGQILSTARGVGSPVRPVRVGWRHEAVATAGDPRTLEGRRVYDTAREGLRNGGHPYGADLPAAARADLLAYLRGL